MKYKHLLAVALAGMLTTGCSTIGIIANGKVNNISPSAMYKLEATYTAAASILAGYRSLPFCSKAPPPCQTGAIARRIRTANAHAYKTIRDLEVFAREHPKLDATALIVGAQIAIADVEALAKEYGSK